MLPRDVRRELQRQAGIVTRPQLLGLGCTAGTIDGWVRRGILECSPVLGRRLAGTYRVPGGGVPHDQHLVAAALRCRPRAWIAGAAVLGLLNFDGFPLIIEYLGDVAHGQPHQRARDHGRNRELEGLGYTVLEVTVRDLDHPDVLRARILGLRAGLLAAGARQTHVATTAQDAGGSDGR